MSSHSSGLPPRASVREREKLNLRNFESEGDGMAGRGSTCGLGKWRPKWLQRFANSKTFVFVYGLLGTIQAMAFIYFVSTLTTLEKRFHIPSQVTGILMSGNEVSQILLSMILSYRGGKGNRPLWMAWGVLFSSVSCFILSSPHWIYGPGGNALSLTEDHLDLALFDDATNKSTSEPQSIGVHQFLCSRNGTREESCDEEERENAILPLVLIFFSQFVLGIGTTLYVTLGQPYLDDNISKKNTPMLLGVTMALRTAGPAAGFVLGYLCLNIYVDPHVTPVIDRKDPRWIGAWWLGWMILGSIMTVFAFLLALFPEKLRRKNPESGTLSNLELERFVSSAGKRKPAEDAGLRDFRGAMKRILTNPLLLSNNLCAVFFILGIAGYLNFYNKYVETQFQSSAATASMFTGVTAVLSMVVGFVSSGVVITKFRPRTSYLLAWNIVAGLIYMCGEISFIFIGCDDGGDGSESVSSFLGTNTEQECYANCSCETVSYFPVCYERGNKTFFSSCHAGCSQLLNTHGKLAYGNCSCLPTVNDVVHQGPCHVDCLRSLITFITIQCVIHLIGCSGKITTILVNYRCVQGRDKELAQGLALFMVSLFAFIPGPIIYGKIIDSTCVVWDNTCGKRGNCWVYDKEKFRLGINSASVGFTSVGVILDFVIWYLGRNLKLYEENNGFGT